MLAKYVAVIGLALYIATPLASAQSEQTATIRLECVWTNTIDTKTLANSKTSGTKVITVEPGGVLRKEGLGADFGARVTSEKIEAETNYRLNGSSLVYTERIKINRYTGKIENWFLIGNEGLIHYGTCRQLSRPIF